MVLSTGGKSKKRPRTWLLIENNCLIANAIFFILQGQEVDLELSRGSASPSLRPLKRPPRPCLQGLETPKGTAPGKPRRKGPEKTSSWLVARRICSLLLILVSLRELLHSKSLDRRLGERDHSDHFERAQHFFHQVHALSIHLPFQRLEEIVKWVIRV